MVFHFRGARREREREMWADTILILVISVCTALLGEGVTWVLVYRTEKYQKLKTEIEKQTKKLEKKKEAHGETANLERSKKRKIEQDEEKLKNTNRDLTMVKMKSMFAIGWSSPVQYFPLNSPRLCQVLPSQRSSQCSTQSLTAESWPSFPSLPSTGCKVGETPEN